MEQSSRKTSRDGSAPDAERHLVDLDAVRTSNHLPRRPQLPTSASTSDDHKYSRDDQDADRSESGPLVQHTFPPDMPPLTNSVSRALSAKEERAERLRFDAFSRLPPLYIFPSKAPKVRAGKQPYWLPEHLMSTSWLTLFYDLVMVAVLNTFATVHEVVRSNAVGVFWSYFCLIWWLWVSQMVYDVRFSAEDLYHRFCKILQIMLFIYIGAASGGWSPTRIKQSDDVFDAHATDEAEAANSFLLISVAYTVSRAISAAQYLILMIVARRTSRPIRSLFVPFVGTVLSGLLCIVAASLSASTQALAIVKPLLLYLGIFIELVALVLTPFLRCYIPIPAHALSERMGALTLIILGEGLLSLVSMFNQVINGFSSDDTHTYLEVFCAVLVVYLIWMMYFTGFDARHWMGRKRAWAWAVLHMPLHFAIMLLLQGIVNVVKFAAFNDGADYIQTKLLSAVVTNGTIAPPVGTNQSADGRTLALQLGKLPLDPSWQDELVILQNAILDPNNPNFPAAQLIQYIGQIFFETAVLYKVEIHKSMTATALELGSLNVTLSGNATIDTHTTNEAFKLFAELQLEGYNSALEGTLWLLPTAGGVLVLIGMTNLARYYFQGMRVPFYDMAQIAVGFVLAMLGLLAIGPQHLDWPIVIQPDGEPDFTPTLKGQNLIFNLVFKDWLLAIVTIVYMVFWLAGLVGLLIRRRLEGRTLVAEDTRASSTLPPSEREPDPTPEREKSLA